MVHSMDKSIGEIIDALHRKNILNDTIIMFFSDNGEEKLKSVFDI